MPRAARPKVKDSATRLAELQEEQARLLTEVAAIAVKEDEAFKLIDEGEQILQTCHQELEPVVADLLRVEHAIKLESQLSDPDVRRRTITARRPPRGRKPPRDLTGRLTKVLELLAADTERTWSARELHEALRRDNGPDVGTLEALRVQLSRWTRQGLVARDGRNSYRLPSPAEEPPMAG